MVKWMEIIIGPFPEDTTNNEKFRSQYPLETDRELVKFRKSIYK